MFYSGRAYEIHRASLAIQLAIRDYIREQLPDGLDGLERYEAIEEQAKSLKVCAFMVKHLIPGMLPTDVTASTKDFILRMIHLKHVDPDREAAIEARDARRWFDEQEAETKIQNRDGSGRGSDLPESGPKPEKPAKARGKKSRPKVRVGGGD